MFNFITVWVWLLQSTLWVRIQNVYALLINLSKLSFPSFVESRTLALTAAMADAMFHVLDCKVLLRRANGCRKCCSTSKNCGVLLFLNVKSSPPASHDFIPDST